MFDLFCFGTRLTFDSKAENESQGHVKSRRLERDSNSTTNSEECESKHTCSSDESKAHVFRTSVWFILRLPGYSPTNRANFNFDPFW